AFAPPYPVRVGGEALTPAIGSEPAQSAELDEDPGGEDHRGAACQREVAFARAQGLTSEMRGDERRRTRGVDGQRGTFETKEIGNAPRGDARGVPGSEIAAVDLLGDAGDEVLVFAGH